MPFALKDGQRQDDTPVHEALREALVNTLVHADYTGRVSVLVVKRPDMFGFRNPGGLRLPIEQVIRGGESDCRNRILHQMFLLIGLGERVVLVCRAFTAAGRANIGVRLLWRRRMSRSKRF